MKIAVATRDGSHVSGHAGQTRHWLVFDLAGHRLADPLPPPMRIELAKDEVFHHFTDDRPHPLDGVEIVVAGSAGDGFLRHMKTRGAEVLLTGETDPDRKSVV
jgi:predicted Fe-Mo cluster-binding NifX family protein